jgi:hypothetical protein
VHGYGTVLLQVVVLGAWGIVARASSGQYADFHHTVVMVVALVLNVTFFLIPAGLLYFATRRRWPTLAVIAIPVWCVIYLACLFVLFAATDGP